MRVGAGGTRGGQPRPQYGGAAQQNECCATRTGLQGRKCQHSGHGSAIASAPRAGESRVRARCASQEDYSSHDGTRTATAGRGRRHLGPVRAMHRNGCQGRNTTDPSAPKGASVREATTWLGRACWAPALRMKNSTSAQWPPGFQIRGTETSQGQAGLVPRPRRAAPRGPAGCAGWRGAAKKRATGGSMCAAAEQPAECLDARPKAGPSSGAQKACRRWGAKNRCTVEPRTTRRSDTEKTKRQKCDVWR